MKECLFKDRTGYGECIAEQQGGWAMQICCSGFANEVPTLRIMAILAEHADTADVTDLVNLDSARGEDPRIVRLVEVARKRGVAIRFFDDDYVDYGDLDQLRGLDLVILAQARYEQLCL